MPTKPSQQDIPKSTSSSRTLETLDTVSTTSSSCDSLSSSPLQSPRVEPGDIYKDFHRAFENNASIERFNNLFKWCQAQGVDLKKVKNYSGRTLTHYAMAYNRDDVLTRLQQLDALLLHKKDKVGLHPKNYRPKAKDKPLLEATITGRKLTFSSGATITTNPLLAADFRDMLQTLDKKQQAKATTTLATTTSPSSISSI